jgi:hypothetical protein
LFSASGTIIVQGYYRYVTFEAELVITIVYKSNAEIDIIFGLCFIRGTIDMPLGILQGKVKFWYFLVLVKLKLYLVPLTTYRLVK